jgi:hypothetical protein
LVEAHVETVHKQSHWIHTEIQEIPTVTQDGDVQSDRVLDEV